MSRTQDAARFVYIDSYAKTAADAKFAEVDAKNTFADDQTLNAINTSSARLRFLTTLIDQQYTITNESGSLNVKYRTDADSFLGNPLSIQPDALTLSIGASDLTFKGEKVILADTLNVFSIAQDISANEPGFRLFELDSTDTNYYVRVVGGNFYVTQISDGGGGLSSPLLIRPNAQQLDMSPTDITYAGDSIRSYAGRVDIGGSMIGGPTGWTVSNTATGTYLVTHNLGVFPAITCNAEHTGDVTCSVAHITVNAFNVLIKKAGVAEDSQFSFIVQTT